MQYIIYVIDDEETIREGITMSLKDEYQVETFRTAEDAFEGCRRQVPDLVLLDVGLPGMSGIEALKVMKERHPDLPVIMITAYEDVHTVISAMKLGAYDYVVKPLYMESLEVTIANSLETVRLRKEVRSLQEKYLRENAPFFISESNAIQDVMELVGQVAASPDTPILIVGETGTGKELIAAAIHYRSPNFKGPLVPVNCASIPRELVESELFGYEKGAFSGALDTGKRGLIEEAGGGTLFLDEVGDLSLESQAKLLRFLEEGEFYRLGGTRRVKIRTRVVSATNKDLDDMIEKGGFRRDLYFRLGVVKVQVPSLNERQADIIPLAKYYLHEFSRKFGKKFTRLSDQAEKSLLAYRWTGNVRELKNMIERAVLIGKGPELTVRELGIERVAVGAEERLAPAETAAPAFPPLPPTGMDFFEAQQSFEKFYFEEALRVSGGNESNAARLLNMNHHTFRYRWKKLQ